MMRERKEESPTIKSTVSEGSYERREQRCKRWGSRMQQRGYGPLSCGREEYAPFENAVLHSAHRQRGRAMRAGVESTHCLSFAPPEDQRVAKDLDAIGLLVGQLVAEQCRVPCVFERRLLLARHSSWTPKINRSLRYFLPKPSTASLMLHRRSNCLPQPVDPAGSQMLKTETVPKRLRFRRILYPVSGSKASTAVVRQMGLLQIKETLY